MAKITKAQQDKITFFIDPIGNTFSMWFDDPRKEHSCEMNEYEDILSLDKKGRIIGFEKLNFLPQEFIKSLALTTAGRMKGEVLLLA